MVERHEIFDHWTRVRNEWLIIRNGRAKSYKFHHTIYSGQELRDRMERAGLKVDRRVLADLSNYIGQELHKLTVEIYRLAGHEFNIG